MNEHRRTGWRISGEMAAIISVGIALGTLNVVMISELRVGWARTRAAWGHESREANSEWEKFAGEIARPHTRGSPRAAPVSADGRRGQRRDALPAVTSSLARQAVADQIDAGATKTRQLAGICLSRAGGKAAQDLPLARSGPGSRSASARRIAKRSDSAQTHRGEAGWKSSYHRAPTHR